MASVEPRWQTRLLGQFQEGAHENKYTGGMLKQRERVRGSLQRIPPDMSVSLRDGRAFVSDERHDNGVRNASILEQADSGVPQRMGRDYRVELALNTPCCPGSAPAKGSSLPGLPTWRH